MIPDTIPLHLRLTRYKQVKQDVETYASWENRHSNKLLKSWESYIKEVKVITYREYCERFYNGTLEEVIRSSYYRIFKRKEP